MTVARLHSDRPYFSATLDAQASAWLSSLDDADRKALRDNVTPLFKELPHTMSTIEVLQRREQANNEEGAEDFVDVVVDALKQTPRCLLSEREAGFRGAVLRAAKEQLPSWKYRAFALWLCGLSRAEISRRTMLHRSTVRGALDGQRRHERRGAIQAMCETVASNAKVKKQAVDVVQKIAEETKRADTAKVSTWYSKIKRGDEQMIGPLALLYLLDALADKKREVRIEEVMALFPRAAISPFLRALEYAGFAKSSGTTIRIHKTPNNEVST